MATPRYADPDLDEAVDVASTEPDEDDDEDEATSQSNGLTRGRVKFTGDLSVHEKNLRARSEARVAKRRATLMKTIDEKMAKFIEDEEERIQLQLGEAALKVEGATVANPEAMKAALARQIEANEKQIRALQEKLASITAAAS